MTKTFKDLSILIISTILITFLIWLPHLLALKNFYGLDFSNGFNTIYRNYDGLEYVIIAKTLYSPEILKSLPQFQPEIYYASHFPLYSLLIILFSPIFGYLKSMLFVSVASTIAAAISFYFLLSTFKLTKQPLTLALIFLILPARWLIVHSVGSSEPLFIFLVICALFCFMKYEQLTDATIHFKNESQQKLLYLFSTALFGLLAQLTRPPGILLFIALVLYIHWKHFVKTGFKNFGKNVFMHVKYWPLIIIPLGLLAMFYWYSISFHDFWAYFHSGDNIHLNFPPFQVFNKNQFWVGEIWLEDIVYIFILGFLGVIYLFKQKLYPLAFFALTYLIASTLVAHRDIARYTLPIFPFLLIAFEKVLISKEFKIVLVIVSVGIYLYAQNFILQNTAPVPNLAAFN